MLHFSRTFIKYNTRLEFSNNGYSQKATSKQSTHNRHTHKHRSRKNKQKTAPCTHMVSNTKNTHAGRAQTQGKQQTTTSSQTCINTHILMTAYKVNKSTQKAGDCTLRQKQSSEQNKKKAARRKKKNGTTPRNNQMY